MNKSTTKWIDRPLADIARALRDGDLTATALTRAAAGCHERWDERLRAYKTWDMDFLARQAEAADAAFAAGTELGPLQGIPVSVKDIFGVEGLPIFGGSPRELPPEWRREGPLVTALRGQLGVIAGKTHSVEFAYGGLGTNDHWGAPWNPWDAEVHRVPGGSSAGAGVSLVEGSALMAFGTDTGGSVRIPASVTGNVGLKTTKDRWSTDGIVPLSATYDTPGILTRTVADAAFAFAALDELCFEPPAAAKMQNLRIGITEDYFWSIAEDSIAGVVRDAIAELERAGAVLVPVSMPEAGAAIDSLGMGAVVAAEAYAHMTTELPSWRDTLQPAVGTRMAVGKDVSAVDYLAARARLGELAARANATLAGVDVLAVPTVPITPPPLTEVATLEDYRDRNMRILSNCTVINQLELCAMTLPAGLDGNGMPVGLQLVAEGWTEERLLAVALACEEVLGTGRQRLGTPPLGGA